MDRGEGIAIEGSKNFQTSYMDGTQPTPLASDAINVATNPAFGALDRPCHAACANECKVQDGDGRWEQSVSGVKKCCRSVQNVGQQTRTNGGKDTVIS